jgi:hypothetical protein
LFGDLNKSPDELIVHIEPEHLSDVGSARIDQIAKELGLDVADLRRFSSISVDVMRLFKQVIDEEHARGRLPLWRGRPDYDSLSAVNDIICKAKNPKREFGVASAKQLTYYIHTLRTSDSLQAFFNWYGRAQVRDPDEFDRVFKFLRSCEYELGEYYSLVELLVNSVAGRRADYSLFVAEMNNLFRPECIKILDERGVPIQISERFYQPNDTTESLATRLLGFALSGARGMTEFEREWVLEVLSD